MIVDLTLTNADVARMTRSDREVRIVGLIKRAHEIVDEAIEVHGEGKLVVATCVLYSGGNDSTTVAHLFRERATHAIHANTGIGIEATRQFVRDVCAEWALPLIEKHPPISYRDLVIERGFPGPAQHWKMYQRLKERCLRQARAELVTHSRRERVVFIAGRRRDESRRRVNVPLHEREGSVIWASPIAEWTKLDLNTYRLTHGDVPRNVVTDVLHMSGECLCGSFAKKHEREQIAEWYPEVETEIAAIEALIAEREDIPEYARKWGYGAYTPQRERARSGPLCSSCEGAA